MNLRILSSLTVVGLILCLAVPTWAAAADPADPPTWDHVNVTTTEGMVYEDVSLVWALEGYSLKLVTADGVDTQINPTRVVAIHDSAGHDITNLVADASPATDVPFSLLGDSAVTPFFFKFMLTVGGSGTMIKGEGGFHFTGAALAGVRIGLGSRTHLHVLYRRQGVVEQAHGLGGTISTNANELHLLMGFRWTHPRQNNNFTYFEVGLSLIRFDHRFNEESETWVDHHLAGPGLTLQGGVVIPLSTRVGLDLGGVMMLRPTLVEDSRDPGMLFGINAAVAFSW